MITRRRKAAPQNYMCNTRKHCHWSLLLPVNSYRPPRSSLTLCSCSNAEAPKRCLHRSSKAPIICRVTCGHQINTVKSKGLILLWRREGKEECKRLHYPILSAACPGTGIRMSQCWSLLGYTQVKSSWTKRLHSYQAATDITLHPPSSVDAGTRA